MKNVALPQVVAGTRLPAHYIGVCMFRRGATLKLQLQPKNTYGFIFSHLTSLLEIAGLSCLSPFLAVGIFKHNIVMWQTGKNIHPSSSSEGV